MAVASATGIGRLWKQRLGFPMRVAEATLAGWTLAGDAALAFRLYKSSRYRSMIVHPH